MPDEPKRILFFDLPAEERKKILLAVVVKEVESLKAKNLPIVYKNYLCVNKNEFIHEYPDGRKFLISININNSEETIIMEF